MKYEAPELEVIEFEVSDVILASETGSGGDNELPPLINPTSVSSTMDLNY